VIEISGYVKLPKIRRGQFSPKDDVDRNCRLVYDKLYFHANFTHNKKSGLLKGQVVMTVAEIAKSCYFITENNVITCLDKLVKSKVIVYERASRYANKGYKITILNYNNLKLSTPCATPEQLPNVLQNAVCDLTIRNDDNILVLENSNSVAHSLATPETTHNKVNYNNIVDGTPPTNPKKRTSKPKVPAPTAPLREAYKRHIMERYGIEPTFAAKENKLVCDILAYFKHDQEKSVAAIGHFFEIKDKFFLDSRHSLTVLRSNLQKIEISLKEKTGYMAAITEDYFGN
jgi:hypothetical protein